MSDKDSLVNRRTILRSTGASLAGSTLLASQSGAKPGKSKGDDHPGNSQRGGRNTDCNGKYCGEVLAEDKETVVLEHVVDGTVYVNYVEKGDSVSQRHFDISNYDRDSLSTQTDGIGTMSHTEIIDDIDGDTDRVGSCGNIAYDDHLESVVAIKTGKEFDNYTTSALSSAICAAVSSAAGPLGPFVASVGCGLVTKMIMDHVPTADSRTAALGAWDNHGGYFDTPEVKYGVADEFTTDVSDITGLDKVPFAHLEGL